MTRAHLEPLVPALEQRHREALRSLPLEEVVRVFEIKANSDDASHGREGNVALSKVARTPSSPLRSSTTPYEPISDVASDRSAGPSAQSTG